jgi:hypothetical protein
VLVAFALLAIGYARPWQAPGLAGGGVDELEQVIASGQATSQTWLAYGEHLFGTQQFARAAMAYEKVLETEPYHRPARFQRALCLARAQDSAGLLEYLRSQLHVEPKLVAELMDRPELGSFLGDASFSSLQKEARAQAMD